MSTVDKIEKLAALKQSGAITEEEFQAQKQALLSLNNTPTGESKNTSRRPHCPSHQNH